MVEALTFWLVLEPEGVGPGLGQTSWSQQGKAALFSFIQVSYTVAFGAGYDIAELPSHTSDGALWAKFWRYVAHSHDVGY